jgi:hypothetical protein
MTSCAGVRPQRRCLRSRVGPTVFILSATVTMLTGEVVLPPVVSAAATTATSSRPHVLGGAAREATVQVRHGARCSGTPITDTRLVVTAAHCVLEADGSVAAYRTVVHDGVEYEPAAVVVDQTYGVSPSPRLDAALLVMAAPIPGASATLGDDFPTHGLVTLAGFQALDTDGTPRRAFRGDQRPLRQGSKGAVVTIESAVAGCVHRVSELMITGDQVKAPCGLVPGASGGGLFTEHDGELTLVGIVSTVDARLTYNGVVPLASVHELLDSRAAHTYGMIPPPADASVSIVVR